METLFIRGMVCREGFIIGSGSGGDGGVETLHLT